MPQSFLAISKSQIFSLKRNITESLVSEFGILARDNHPLHTDNKYAQKKGFGTRVVYGNILGLMISSLVGETMADYELMLISQLLYYKKPVFIGDEITVVGEVTEIKEVFKLIEVKLKFQNSNNITVATGKCQLKYLDNVN